MPDIQTGKRCGQRYCDIKNGHTNRGVNVRLHNASRQKKHLLPCLLPTSKTKYAQSIA